MNPDILPWLQFGIAGAFLSLLFLGLRSGAIYTKSAVTLINEQYEKRLADKDKYIEKLEFLNQKIDERNDVLTKQVNQMLEVSRAHGMIEALPPQVAERALSK